MSSNRISEISTANRPLTEKPAINSKPTQGGATADFSSVLAGARQTLRPAARPRVSRWHSLGFLATPSLPRTNWPWLQPNFDRTIDRSLATGLEASKSVLASSDAGNVGPAMALADYPRPVGDNGKGIHWIPTVKQPPEVVDRFVDEAVSMGMKWVVFLNDGANIGDNDYLVKKLTGAGIEPIMRIYTPGLSPINGNLKKMVEHFTGLGVRYFQLYNEPNLMVETGGRYPNADRYLDLWIPAAKQVIAGGGLPGFGALSPQGEMDDREFLRQSLADLLKRGAGSLLNKSWLAMHNYTGPRPLTDPNGFMRFKQYNAIIQQILGRPLPIIGTEGGTHISDQVNADQQVDMVTNAYNYMEHQREPYNFAYTYWIIANGHDSAWDKHALFKANGPTELAKALKKLAAGVKE